MRNTSGRERVTSASRRPHHRGSLTTLAALLVLALSGCTGGGSDASSRGDSRGGVETATVTRESLEIVTTVAATVRAGAEVEITAPGAGTVERLSGKQLRFALDSGRTVTLDFPEGLTVTDELVPEGRRVPANLPVAKGRVAGFAMVAELDRPTLYKVYEPPLDARAQISQGPGPFDCPLANTVPTMGEQAPAEGPDSRRSGLTIACVIPPDVNVFAGMTGIMALRTAALEDALLLPVEAVAGSAERGRVEVVRADGSTETRGVELGATDGALIEIVAGVRKGDRVRIPAPDLAGMPDDEGGTGDDESVGDEAR